MPINPNYIKVDSDEIDTRKRYPIVLDIADSIYIANYFLSYFAPSGNASELSVFRRLKILKRKVYMKDIIIHFLKKVFLKIILNQYLLVGTPNDARTKTRLSKTFDLTSSH